MCVNLARSMCPEASQAHLEPHLGSSGSAGGWLAQKEHSTSLPPTLSQPPTHCCPGWGSNRGDGPAAPPEAMAFAPIPVVEAECEKSSATTYFWYREALDISNSISESGGLNWKMTLCLLVAWSIVGMAVVKGIQSSGKVSQEGSQTRTGCCKSLWEAGG